MSYEMEKIKAQNKYEIIFKTDPDNVTRVYPSKGYKWKNENANKDYTVEEIGNSDIDNFNNGQKLYNRAYEYYYNYDYQNALSLVTQSINIAPASNSYILRSYIFSHIGRYNEALEDIGTTLNYEVSDKSFATFYIIKAFIFDMMHKPFEALPQIDKGIRLLEKTSYESEFLCEAYSMMGTIKLELGDYQNAVKDINKAIEILPNYAFPFLAMANAKLFIFDYAGALSYLDETFKLLNDNEYAKKFDIFKLKAEINNKIGNYKETLLLTNEAINIYDSNNFTFIDEYSECFFLRGMAKIKLEIRESGCLDLLKAIQMGYKGIDRFYNENCK